MKILSAFIVVLFLCGCHNPSIPPPPKEPCNCSELSHYPVITNGFTDPVYDTVLLQVFYANSRYDSLLNEFNIALDEVADEQRATRDIDLPRGLQSCVDLRFVFADSLVFTVDSIQSKWVKRYCQGFCGYDCTHTSYRINDSTQTDGNFHFMHPSFRFSWEK